ncbi:hypothetical protein HDU98_008814 [Podochytrium sp. JEL0797]|nr:hypothetical protein HDU98_008814 [Podochytrium sp. JEL0797]
MSHQAEAGCNHVERPAAAKHMSIMQKQQLSGRFLSLMINDHPFTTPSGKQVQMNPGSAIKLVISDSGALFADFLVRHLTNETNLWTYNASQFYLEMSVDAFLNHDFQFSSSFYGMYLLINAAMKCSGGVRGLFQNGPSLINLAHQLKSSMMAESGLLAAMQGNPSVLCDCLNAEDPYHPNFGKTLPSNLLFNVELEKRPRGYKVDCMGCQKRPDVGAEGGKDFQRCGGCQRVRYCSRECQRADWKEHKKVCGVKVAEWWGRTPKMSKQERADMGFV